MSVKENLIEQRTQLVLQRATLKDQLEGNEKALGVVAFAIQALEESEKEADASVKEPEVTLD